ncbi:MAG: tyrosine-type recombinase/integrase [Salinivirgaceae bacterium]|nr:tyrosine-type recombinase/integrase [Salinivirgaceae bacterium]
MKRFYPYVKEKYNTKNGIIPIYIRYDYNRVKRTLIPINLSCAVEHWDFKKKWIKKSCPEFETIEKKLVSMQTHIGNIITWANKNDIDPTIEHIHLELAKDKQYDSLTKRIDIFSQLDKYIEDKKTKVVGDVIKDYNSLKKHLLGFREYSSQAITFQNINVVFYNEFLDYLSYTVIQKDGSIGLKNNTVGKQIKNLKAFVRDRISKNIIPPIDLKPFKTIIEEVDNIYLSEEELEEIYNLDLSGTKKLEEIRDLFIVGCYTGLRFSDLSRIDASHIDIHKGTITIKQKKVHRSVTVPIIEYTPAILKKHKNELPKMHLNDFNREIKEICKQVGLTQDHNIVQKKGKNQITNTFKKYEIVSSHTCRRSFCTNMYLSGFPVEDIMKISGHKSIKAFLTYIKIDSLQAAQRLKIFWANRTRGNADI